MSKMEKTMNNVKIILSSYHLIITRPHLNNQ